MPLFAYKAQTIGGQTISGQIDAHDRHSAIDMILSSGQTPIKLKKVREGSDWRSWFQYRSKDLTSADVGTLSQDLSRLLASGFSLHQALQMVAVSTESKPTRIFAETCADHVSKGGNLSEVLGQQSGGPVRALAGLVQAGEASGELETILMQAGESFEKASAFKEKLASALIYPMIILFMISLTLIVFFSFVLPRLEPLFEDVGDRLPLATKLLLAFGAFMEVWIVWLLFGVLIGFALLQLFPSFKTRFKFWWDRKTLGRLGMGVPRLSGYASYARTLGLLLNSGVPLTVANQVSADGLRNTALSKELSELTSELREGQPLSERLEHVGTTPDVLVRMSFLGEKSGKLGPALIDAAGILERKAQSRTERLLAALTPSITIFLGLLVTLVVGSLFLGIASLTDVQI